MITIKAKLLFWKIERKVPLSLAFPYDTVGYLGTESAEDLDVNKILMMMDYIPVQKGIEIDYDAYDLLVLHHPPVTKPKIPSYVIHSNWDIVSGGACDALADCLNITVNDVFDKKARLGRIGTLERGPVPLPEFCKTVREKLSLNTLRAVNFDENTEINKICLIPGFGLNPKYIEMAHEEGADLYLSGDLTHPGAILAKNSGIVLIDATHHATEVPGLYRLRELIAGLGIDTEIIDTKVPWQYYIGERGNIQNIL